MGSFKTEDLGELVIQPTKCVWLLIICGRHGTKLQELGREWVLIFFRTYFNSANCVKGTSTGRRRRCGW